MLKRKYSRVGSLNLIHYICIDPNGLKDAQGMGRTLNVSEGGMLLETSRGIDQSYTLSLQIGLENEVVEIKGRVVHSKPGGDNRFEIGIEFFDLDSKTIAVLRRYITAFENQHELLENIGIKIDPK